MARSVRIGAAVVSICSEWEVALATLPLHTRDGALAANFKKNGERGERNKKGKKRSLVMILFWLVVILAVSAIAFFWWVGVPFCGGMRHVT